MNPIPTNHPWRVAHEFYAMPCGSHIMPMVWRWAAYNAKGLNGPNSRAQCRTISSCGATGYVRTARPIGMPLTVVMSFKMEVVGLRTCARRYWFNACAIGLPAHG